VPFSSPPSPPRAAASAVAALDTCRRRAARGRLVVAMLAIAVIAYIAIGSSLLPTTSRQQASDRTVKLASSSAPPAAGSTKGTERDPAWCFRGGHSMSGERAALGLTLQGRVDGALALPTGMTLSIGSDIGADARGRPLRQMQSSAAPGSFLPRTPSAW
jgi:hypothetical protein